MNTVTPKQIQALMADSTFETAKMGQKTCVVVCTLPSGFEVVGTGSCVDPANYDHETGVQIAKKKIEDKLWELLGYVLQNQL